MPFVRWRLTPALMNMRRSVGKSFDWGGVDGKRNYENLYLQKQNSLRKGLS